MSTDMDENSISDVEKDSTPYVEENSIPVEITMDAAIDMNPQELESPEQDTLSDILLGQDALIDMLPQESERSVLIDDIVDMLSQRLESHTHDASPTQDALIDMPPQELESPVQIFVIPSYVKERNPRAYQPKMVSIGPYHYGKPQLKPMQSHKKRAVYQFLTKSPTKATEEQYLERLMQVHDQLWGSYEQVPELCMWTPDKFIKLMMVDGIFLLEFLNVSHGDGNGNGYAATDFIFGKRGHTLNYSYVMEDLLLLENQVPYLVLSALLTVSEGLDAEQTEEKLARLMLAPAATKGHHLLDMYMKGTMGDRGCREPVTGEIAVKVSAAELTATYSVKFMPVATYKDIKFHRRAKTLSLPTIFIDQGTVRKYNNLKAYQILSGDSSKELISYIHLLNFFILSAVDVNTLCSQGIIVSSLGSDEDITRIIKELTRDTMTGNFILDDISGDIIKQVMKYYCDKHTLHDCFTSLTLPWRWTHWVLAIAGIIIYFLNLVDSLFSISYYSKN